MCGIIAAWSHNGRIEKNEIERCLNLLSHRGPDDKGVELINPALALAQTRLSIIDITPAGHQPMKDSDTGNIITYNGEMYNYRELRRELETFGSRFRTQSDTEVLLKAYAQWGTQCLNRFIGMFAFVLWDDKKQALFAARDRLGIKPLYWIYDGRRFMAASELKALQAYLKSSANLRLHEGTLPYYLTMRCAPAGQTLMAGVQRLSPGRYLWVEQAGRNVKEHSYWRLADYANERTIQEEDAVEELESRLRIAVRRRLVADVPVGCFLSGGVDSSLVTLIAGQESEGRRIHSFSVDFAQQEYSEREHFERVAAQANTISHVVTMSPDKFLGFLTSWVYYMDDLVSDPSSLPLYFVAQQARSHGVKVVLSGEGADELLGGYGSYLQIIRRRGLMPWARAMPFLSGVFSDPDRKDLWRRLGGAFPFRGTAYVFGESFRGKFLRRDEPLEPWVRSIYSECSGLDPDNQMLYFDLATRIPSDLLMRTDRATMAASIECRVPFLDHELVQAGIGLPSSLKFRNGQGKYILKKLACRYFPSEMVLRPKVGFNVPLSGWFKTQLKPLLERVFLQEQKIEALNYDAIRIMLESHWNGNREHGARIWNLLALELWYRRWILDEPINRT